MQGYNEWLDKLDLRKHMYLFETEAEAFLSTPIAEWPKKLVELTTSAAFR